MPVDAAEVSAWISANWDPAITLREWWSRLCDAGYSQPTWPIGLGGLACNSRDARVIAEVMASHGTIAAPTGMGPHMGGPTLLEHGNDQQQQWLRQVATGEQMWCQLFSEPDVGSDLAGLKTVAVADGDDFVVHGQKVWNSSADKADWGMLLARTDPTVPKHAGLTFFLIDMRQPGIEVRPLRTMNGSSQFCEVFLNGARTTQSHAIGGLGNGWRVASTMLGHERRMAASGTARGSLAAQAGPLGAELDQTVGHLVDAARNGATTRELTMITSASALIRLAQRRGSNTDPVLRDALVGFHILSEVYRLTNLRARAGAAAGRAPGPEASIAKLALSGLARLSRDLGVRIAGAGGMILGPDSVSGGQVQHCAISAPGVSIGGGTDEIQHNVIGERALGLPREP